MSAITFDHIRKSYGGTQVLRDVSLSIESGEFLTLLGPSGCGKSTLLRILAGLERQDEGSVSIGNCTVDDLRPKSRDIAMVFQSYALYPHMTVAGNMAVPLRMRRLNSWERLPLLGKLLPGTRSTLTVIDTEVKRTAAALGIDHLLARKPGQLSGGQRQRVAVGRAMVREPAVFLMDEPLSNLDAKLRVQMRAEIKDLHRRLGVTFIYVTHDQAEAMTLSDRVAVMLDGELLQVAPPQEIYADPNDRRVAEFIGSPKINMLDGRVIELGIMRTAGAHLSVPGNIPLGTRLTAGIRPEAFTFTTEPDAPNVIEGSVHMVEHMGSDLFVHLLVEGMNEPLIVRLHTERAPHIGSGLRLEVGVKPAHMMLFDAAGHRLPTTALRNRVTPIRETA
ncbi:glycerol-3-phosphate ABC transporter ATP-binding protein [Sinorhizobium meliloti]|uniref:ABC transporter ATP-binding protein n=1 Tax=Rhizobium meliloti TaxID=382 RepID=UPI000614882D|nr:ABC transporter ATP-binding protein [Sinorhizobium meliloti]KKA10866.1 glycerol-3-phosphate ABC transporter ATP-binding protein [Sinorhizobium meliloti]